MAISCRNRRHDLGRLCGIGYYRNIDSIEYHPRFRARIAGARVMDCRVPGCAVPCRGHGAIVAGGAIESILAFAGGVCRDIPGGIDSDDIVFDDRIASRQKGRPERDRQITGSGVRNAARVSDRDGGGIAGGFDDTA